MTRFIGFLFFVLKSPSTVNDAFDWSSFFSKELASLPLFLLAGEQCPLNVDNIVHSLKRL